MSQKPPFGPSEVEIQRPQDDVPLAIKNLGIDLSGDQITVVSPLYPKPLVLKPSQLLEVVEPFSQQALENLIRKIAETEGLRMITIASSLGHRSENDEQWLDNLAAITGSPVGLNLPKFPLVGFVGHSEMRRYCQAYLRVMGALRPGEEDSYLPIFHYKKNGISISNFISKGRNSSVNLNINGDLISDRRVEIDTALDILSLRDPSDRRNLKLFGMSDPGSLRPIAIDGKTEFTAGGPFVGLYGVQVDESHARFIGWEGKIEGIEGVSEFFRISSLTPYPSAIAQVQTEHGGPLQGVNTFFKKFISLPGDLQLGRLFINKTSNGEFIFRSQNDSKPAQSLYDWFNHRFIKFDDQEVVAGIRELENSPANRQYLVVKVNTEQEKIMRRNRVNNYIGTEYYTSTEYDGYIPLNQTFFVRKNGQWQWKEEMDSNRVKILPANGARRLIWQNKDDSVNSVKNPHEYDTFDSVIELPSNGTQQIAAKTPKGWVVFDDMGYLMQIEGFSFFDEIVLPSPSAIDQRFLVRKGGKEFKCDLNYSYDSPAP